MAKKIGCYSGIIYEDNFKTGMFHECTLPISDELAENKEKCALIVKSQHEARCDRCMKCPRAKNRTDMLEESK